MGETWGEVSISGPTPDVQTVVLHSRSCTEEKWELKAMVSAVLKVLRVGGVGVGVIVETGLHEVKETGLFTFQAEILVKTNQITV